MSGRRLHVNCLRATELVEQRAARKLSIHERLGLWGHLLICAGCRAYRKHSALIDRWLCARRDDPPVTDSTELEERILRETIG